MIQFMYWLFSDLQVMPRLQAVECVCDIVSATSSGLLSALVCVACVSVVRLSCIQLAESAIFANFGCITATAIYI